MDPIKLYIALECKHFKYFSYVLLACEFLLLFVELLFISSI